jgi:hypothetical protein
MKIKEKTDLVKHHAAICKKIDGMLKTLDGLREDPLFIDNIHGEQELSLDQTIELFTGIKANFVAKNVNNEVSAAFEAASFDVS